MSIEDGFFGPSMVKECIIQDNKRKVILKFKDGDVQVATAEEEDTFNPEVGILWATMKHLMNKYGICSAYKYVESCLQKNEDRRNRKEQKKDELNTDGSDKKTFRRGQRSKTNVFDDYWGKSFKGEDETDDMFTINIMSNESVPESMIYCHPLMALELLPFLNSILDDWK